VAVGLAALDFEMVLERDGRSVSTFEEQPQSRDDLRLPVGDVGQGAFLDLAVLAVGFAHKNGGRRVAIGDDVDRA
jgi:hypothetical protein